MISNLQVLRGLAALAVVLYHTNYALAGGVHTMFQAVAVFFVISGFIMTHITREKADGFLLHRLIRIVPLYWLCTLFALAAAELKGFGRMWTDGSLENIAKSLLFVPYRDMTGEIQPLLLVGWTLNLEMFFYLLFAGALLISRRYAPFLVCVALIAFKLIPSALGCTAIPCVYYAHDYTTFLILGVASYYVWRLLSAGAMAARWVVLLAAPIIGITFLASNAYPPFAAALQARIDVPLYFALPASVVSVALLLHSAEFQCKWKPLLLLGDASYALYLTHAITIQAMRAPLSYGSPTPSDPEPSFLAAAPLVAVSALVAIAVYAWIEAPTLKALRKLLVPHRPTTAVLQSAPR